MLQLGYKKELFIRNIGDNPRKKHLQMNRKIGINRARVEDVLLCRGISQCNQTWDLFWMDEERK